MKKFLLGMTLLTSLTTYADTKIIFEEQTTTTTKLTIINNGEQIKYGDIDVARAPRTFQKGHVRIGDKVITSDNRSGVVQSMFVAKNTIVVYDSYYGNRTWKLSDIAVTSGCVNDSLCVGDDVITSDEREGKIAGYFGDGNVVIYDSYYGNRTWEQKEIAITYGCTNLFCKDDKVITSDNRSGRVSGFFRDGTVIIYDHYYGNRTWNQGDISVTEGLCTNIYIKRIEFCK